MVMVTTGWHFGLRIGGVLLAAALLAGCGLGGDGESKQDGAKTDSGVARALRAIGAAKDAFGDQSGANPDTVAAQAQAQDGERLDRESIAAMTEQMDEEVRRMKASGDMSGAGDVMRRMMELGNAMQSMDESNPPAAGMQAAVTAAATPAGESSDEMRALGGIPVRNDPLSQEQRLSLFAPQALEGAP